MSCCGNKTNYFSHALTNNNNGSCCKQNNSCCNNTNSCCNNSNGCCNNTNSNSCCSNTSNQSNSCCDYTNDLTGVSCPFNNNNDCICSNTLREALCNLTNQRVIIHVDGCKMCVVIVGIGSCFIKTVNPCTQRVVYFNLNRIDNVEDVLPRCYS